MKRLSRVGLLAGDLILGQPSDQGPFLDTYLDNNSRHTIHGSSFNFSESFTADGETVSDDGGVEGSQQTLRLAGKGGGTLEYRYQHFTIPDNFIIRYDGKNLLETGFVGGGRSGKIRIPKGDSSEIQVIVATNDEGTAWNYEVTANSCASPDPFSLELASGEWIASTNAAGDTVCKGTGTIFVGRSDGDSRMLRVEGSAEFDSTSFKFEGTVYSLFGTGQILTQPLFTGSAEIPFKTGTSTSFSETPSTGEYQLGGMDVDFDKLSVNRDSLALGAKFELIEDLGFPDFIFSGPDGLIITKSDVQIGPSIRFSAPDFSDVNLFKFVKISEFSDFSIELIGSEDAVKIQGKLKLSLGQKNDGGLVDVTANLAGDNYIQIKGGKADIKGELKIESDLKLPKGWGLKEVRLLIDTIEKDIGGAAKLVLPVGKAIEVDGEVGFKLPMPPVELNKLALGVDNLNVPIPQFPLAFFQSLRGSVENFAASDPDPIEFGGGVSLTLGPQIAGASLLRVDLDGKVSSEQISGTGTTVLISEEIAKATGTSTLNWDDGFFETKGSYVLLDGLIETNGGFKTTSKYDFSMNGQAKVKIPDFIPLFGGEQIGSGNFALKYSNNGTLSDDYAAGWGAINIQNFGVDINIVIGFKGYFDGRFERIGAKNIPPVGSFDIKPGTPWALIGVDWENPFDGQVPLMVELPDGSVIEESEFAAHNVAIVEELSDSNTRVVILVNPQPGIWDLQLVNPDGLGQISYSAAENGIAPEISAPQTSTSASGALVDITYTGSDADSPNATVSLYYDNDKDGFDGVLIASGLPGVGTHTYQWTTTNVPNGDYFIYATIQDADNPPESVYAESKVAVAVAADLTVSHSVGSSITVGDSVEYIVRVSNLGPTTATGVQAVFELPANAILQSTSIPASQSGSQLVFDLPNLQSTQVATFSVFVRAPVTPSSLQSEVLVRSAVFDPAAFNDTDRLTLPVNDLVVLPPNLELKIENTPTTVKAGESYSYDVVIKNAGQGAATLVTLEESLPSGVVLLNVETAPGLSFTTDGSIVAVSLGTLAAGATTRVKFILRSSVAGDLISTSNVSCDELETLSLDNNLITVISAGGTDPTPADLSLSLVSDSTDLAVGESVQLRLSLSNSGPGIASGISIRMLLPESLQFESFSSLQGDYSPQTGIWSIGNLRDQVTRTLFVNATFVGEGNSKVTAELISANEADIDSSPNNGVETEDDMAVLELDNNLSMSIDTLVVGLNRVEIRNGTPGGVAGLVLGTGLGPSTVSGLPMTFNVLTPIVVAQAIVQPDGRAVLYFDIANGSNLTSIYLQAFQQVPEQQVSSVVSSDAQATNNPKTIAQRADVNADGRISAVDALLVINHLNSLSNSRLSGESSARSVLIRNFDINGDGRVSPIDALLVIDQLTMIRRQIPEGESSARQENTVPAKDLEPYIASVDSAFLGFVASNESPSNTRRLRRR